MKKLSPPARYSLIVVILCLAMLWIFPMWRFIISSRHFLHGLTLKIWINNVSGDIDIINGLNTYIGMQKIHRADFPEFIYLPLCILIFIGLAVATFIINRKKVYYILALIFVGIGSFTLFDFYEWEYRYGHTLDPNAPIKFPGQGYQPPLIGYRKMLNYDILSMPDTGGWLYIIAGVILVFFAWYEWRKTINSDQLAINS